MNPPMPARHRRVLAAASRAGASGARAGAFCIVTVLALSLAALPAPPLQAQTRPQGPARPEDAGRPGDPARPEDPGSPEGSGRPGEPVGPQGQAPPRSQLAFPPVKVSWSFEAWHSSCPDAPVFTGTVSFPRETGSAVTDARIAGLAEGWLAEARARALRDVSGLRDPCAQVRDGAEGQGLFMEISYSLFRPSPGLLGVLFTDRGFDGGPRAWLGYTAYTWRLGTGEPLAAADLFPDPDKGRAGIWNLVWAAVCGADPPRETLPSLFGGAPCTGKAPPPPPEGFLAGAESLEDLGSLVLTEKGALLNVEPSSAWSWAEGPFILNIPRIELERLGADPSFWGK